MKERRCQIIQAEHPRDEHEANARAKSPEVELSVLLEFHRLEEYGPYISIEDVESPSYQIESDDEQQRYAASVWLTPYNPKTVLDSFGLDDKRSRRKNEIP